MKLSQILGEWEPASTREWLAQMGRTAPLGSSENPMSLADAVALRIERGERPEKSDIVELLRSDLPLPPMVRSYAAGLLDGSVKQKRGPKRATAWVRFLEQNRDAWIRRRLAAAVRLENYLKTKESRPDADPYENALTRVAVETGLTEDQLDKIFYPRRPRP